MYQLALAKYVTKQQGRNKWKRKGEKGKLSLERGEGAVADIHQQRVESSTARGIAARSTTSSSAWRGKEKEDGRRHGG